jgi:hypothetical protein
MFDWWIKYQSQHSVQKIQPIGVTAMKPFKPGDYGLSRDFHLTTFAKLKG